MKRWTTMILMVVGLAWTTGCASGDKKKTDDPDMPTETEVELPVDKAIVGTWGAPNGATAVFNDDGTYVWETVTTCGKPPCPKSSTRGSWKVQHGNKLYLTPQGGELAIHDVSVSGSTLDLRDPKGGEHHFYK